MPVVVTVSVSVFACGSGSGSTSVPVTSAVLVSGTPERTDGSMSARKVTVIVALKSKVSAGASRFQVSSRSPVPPIAGLGSTGGVVPPGTVTVAEFATYDMPAGSASSIRIGPLVALGP